MNQLIKDLLVLLTLASNIFMAVFILLLLIKSPHFERLKLYLSKNALLFSFIVATAATLGSLFYSEIAGYEPCKLCWYQRIFMYPLTILFFMAWKNKDHKIINYALVLSIIGGAIALYHYLLQLNFIPSGSCGVVGYSASCSQRFVLSYGYITIPMMALTAFGLIVLFLLHTKKN